MKRLNNIDDESADLLAQRKLDSFTPPFDPAYLGLCNRQPENYSSRCPERECSFVVVLKLELPAFSFIRNCMNQTRSKSGMAAAKYRKRVSALLKSLPGAQAVPMSNGHLSLEVRGKRFGWFLDDHHGDGRIALNLKAPKGAGQRLAEFAPDRFHVPRYLGRRGWVGVWLDRPATDWVEIKELLESACQLTPQSAQTKNLQSTKS